MASRNIRLTQRGAHPTAVNWLFRVDRLNLWRESYNPLRGLTIQRAVSLLESYPRGEFADLMWTYAAPGLGIECADADLIALIERRVGAVLEMDYNIKTVDEDSKGYDPRLAEEQHSALTEAYNAIDNLYDAIEHLCMATFRGFAQVEKWRDEAGAINHLEIVDQWNVVRDGLKGAWKYNPEARSTNFYGLPDENLMEPENFIWREVARPVNRIALIKAIREGLSQKDWDAFIEIYGVPGGVVTLPPNIPEDQVAAYEQAAREIATGGSGALPNGASYTANSSPHGTAPFKEHLEYLTQKLVLAGTGGLLTMLAESGSGTLAGSAHMEAFKTLATAEAKKISQAFQRYLDAEVIKQKFPGCPVLAYFELAANEETDTSKVVADIGTLGAAGYQVSPDQITEKTGYEVTLRPQPTAAPMFNRAPSVSTRGHNDLPTDEEIAGMLNSPALAAAADEIEQLLSRAAQS